MIDFLLVSTRSKKKEELEIYPKFIIKKSSDLMIRGGDFYAIWVEERALWSTDEQDALMLIDRELDRVAEEYRKKFSFDIKVLHMWDAGSGMIDAWHRYCQKQMRDNFHPLDEKLIFSNTETKKTDYASKRLDYPLEPGDYSAYDKLMSVLYAPEERQKIEWAIGAVVTGDSKTIQKFVVLYGAAGTGKSTVLNIINQLFAPYTEVFKSKELGSSNNAFALEAFRKNPLVAIEHDGKLSRIEDNTVLNSLVSHEQMTVNEKFKTTYSNAFKVFLFIGTNDPVRITDAKSGLIRRLIDVVPSGEKLNVHEYNQVMRQIKFESGAIACHCRDVYLSNPERYDDYIPVAMLGATNDFYNFVEDSYLVFKKNDGTPLRAAWKMYNEYCEEAKVPKPLPMRAFKEELKNYFKTFDARAYLEDGSRPVNYYSGFRADKFETALEKKDPAEETKAASWLIFKEQPSLFDKEYAGCPAQYATDGDEKPLKGWDSVTTTLADLDTSRLHYILTQKQEPSLVVMDFDLKDENGNKSLERNLEAASKWPPTYAELSKSGAAIHLHYIYLGDISKLSRIYGDDIEIKVFTGKSSLRRKLVKCNDIPIAAISSGLPLKEEKHVINEKAVKSERGIRSLIKRNLNKEFHDDTSSSINFIDDILSGAYNSGMHYDVSDMIPAVMAFAANSTHQSERCLEVVSRMKFRSEESSPPDEPLPDNLANVVNEIHSVYHGAVVGKRVFFDIEIFPNLCLVNYKVEGEGMPVVRLINPSPREIEPLIMHMKLIGFNCRRYDNHILYAAYMGYDNQQLYDLSRKIIDEHTGFLNEAYNVSYTDVYDFAAKKQSLKKWEIELGIHHQELGLPWDEPVPEELWPKVAEYCDNDVLATEAVFNHLQGDFTARKILADLAGGTVNDTTNSLTTKIIFGNERHPKLVYTNLEEVFPGYEFKQIEGDNKFHNMYRSTDMGFGGYIVSYPGIYVDVALLDIQSMHPNSAIAMNYFGEYTPHFKDILDARVAIKHGDYDTARKMMGGKLAPYLDDESQAKDLAQALKIAINSVYGLTAASFDNPFRDVRNKNNIVALRGALFMRTLQDEVTERGFKIVAIKTDSIKIANATPEIIKFCMDFAAKYGYIFEHEATYSRICQINDADYIARYASNEYCSDKYGYLPGDNKKHGSEHGGWTATGKQFAVPYVFKKLFSKEEVVFSDLCETKSVSTAIYLDMNEGLPDVTAQEKELEKAEDKYKKGLLSDTLFEPLCGDLNDEIAKGHNYKFVGKVGLFCPIKAGSGGGELVAERKTKDGIKKYVSVAGAKGRRWLESEMVKNLGMEDAIDISYYDTMLNDMADTISQYGDFEWFVSDDIEALPPFMNVPETDNDEVPFDEIA